MKILTLTLFLIVTISLHSVHGMEGSNNNPSGSGVPRGRGSRRSSTPRTVVVCINHERFQHPNSVEEMPTILGHRQDNHVSVQDILRLPLNRRGYYAATSVDMHIRPFANLHSSYAVTNPPEVRVEPSTVTLADETHNLGQFALGQIVTRDGEPSIVLRDSRENIINTCALHPIEIELYNRMKARNPRTPESYIIPQVYLPHDTIFRLVNGRLEMVGTINVYGWTMVAGPRFREIPGIAQYNDLLAREVGPDPHTGLPIYQAIALAWRRAWIAPVLFPLIDGRP